MIIAMMRSFYWVLVVDLLLCSLSASSNAAGVSDSPKAPAAPVVDLYVPFDSKNCIDKLTVPPKRRIAKMGLGFLIAYYEVETLDFAGGQVCRFEFHSKGNHKIAIAYRDDKTSTLHELYTTSPFPDEECGTQFEMADMHRVALQHAQSTKALLFIEKGQKTPGCYGQAEITKSELMIFDPEKSATALKVLPLEDSCQADTEGGGKCVRRGKKIPSYGTQENTLWSLCESSCEKLEIERRPLHKKIENPFRSSSL